jgi:hypothetical protein
MKCAGLGTAGRRRVVVLLTAAFSFKLAALDLGFDLGAGAKIDVAVFGIENMTALAAASCWIDVGKGLAARLVTAASAGNAKVDFEASLCLDLRPFECAACFAGGGAVASSRDEPVLVPMLIGGLRVGSRRFGALACVEIHLKPEDADTMLWAALVFSFEYPKRK